MTEQLEPEAKSAEKLGLGTQLTRFVVSGGISAVVDFGLLKLGMDLLGFNYSLAKAISFVAGTTTAYLINRRWTFRAEPSKRRFAAVVALYGITFLIQWGIFTLLFPLVEVRSNTDIAQVVTFVVAQGVATTVNFIIQRTVIFR